jgi:hypothetical protein
MTLETIAVYWEPVIRTYGFQTRTGLTLVCWEPASGSGWGLAGHDAGLLSGADLLMAVALPSSCGGLRMGLVFSGKLSEAFSGLKGCEERPVELIYFQGPHFGDRYGIAAAAFGALHRAAVPVIAAGCTGASIYIVLEPGRADEAAASLSDAFRVPASTA